MSTRGREIADVFFMDAILQAVLETGSVSAAATLLSLGEEEVRAALRNAGIVEATFVNSHAYTLPNGIRVHYRLNGGRVFAKHTTQLRLTNDATGSLAALNNSVGALEWLTAFAPSRIVNEEIADAIEVLHRLAAAGAPPRVLRVKVWSTVFWCVINSLREMRAAWAGKKSK